MSDDTKEPFYIKVVNTVEHEDGSATYSFDVDDEARNNLANLGLELVLHCAAKGMDIQDVFKLILQNSGDKE